VIDALAYSIEMFSLGNRIFQAEMTPEESAALDRGVPYDEYANLTYDPPLRHQMII
jgi:hypothetical protein